MVDLSEFFCAPVLVHMGQSCSVGAFPAVEMPATSSDCRVSEGERYFGSGDSGRAGRTDVEAAGG